MDLIILEEDFSILKITNINELNFCCYTFLSITDDEISLVCPTNNIPNNYKKIEKGWKAIKIDGLLDFSLIGVLSKITSILAENNIGVFVISTFNTDYILLKEKDIEKGKSCLHESGYSFI